LPGRWRDLAVGIEGPPVETLDAIFRADWGFAAKADLAPAIDEARRSRLPGAAGPLAQVVPSGPDRPDDSLYDVVLQAVFSARQRVWIATPYFVPDDALCKALELAMRRRVDVRIVVPARSNHRLADLVAGSFLRDLAEAGADVRRYEPRMLHAKALLIDDAVAVVGSANFDLRSLYLDYEVALLLYGEAETRWLAAWFEATCASAQRGVAKPSWLTAKAQATARLLAPLV
jgi:cardiolipin synthase A/B